MTARQARIDSEIARMRAHEVAPDFVQPGEANNTLDVILDIDRMSGISSNNYIPVQQNMILPAQNSAIPTGDMNNFVKSNTPGPNMNAPQIESYMNWQQQSNFNTPHSSTPPPLQQQQQQQYYHQQQQQIMSQQNQRITPTRTFNTNIQPSGSSSPNPQKQFYVDTNLNTTNPVDFPPNTMFSSNQHQMYPLPNDSQGQNINNESK